jgi:hypothetical protein
MTTRAGLFAAALCASALLCFTALAQTGERGRATPSPRAPEQTPDAQPAAADTLTGEVALLRKSVQTLNARLREISDKLLAPDAAAKQADASNPKQNRLASHLDILTRAEQRAEVMRKQLLELTEKETWFKNRLVQIDEDSRPDSIDRTLALVGSVRTPDMRDTRRRVLENERAGVQNLLGQTSQGRQRLEEDLKQADALVSRLRQRLLPLIEKEIDKINPEERQ